MRKNLLMILSSFLMIIVLLSSCEKETDELITQKDVPTVLMQDGDVIPGEYIVVFNEATFANKSIALEKDYKTSQELMKQEVSNFLASKNLNNQYNKVYTKALLGFSGKFSDEEIEVLYTNKDISGIYPNRMVILRPPWEDPDPGDDPTQQTPWGISRVNGGVDGTGLVAWILDTGIDLDHADLNVDAARGASFDPRASTPDDDNGHGSHCAGIVAAINNDIGVIGVAANATVIPVKVLNRRGSGAYDDIIAGVEFVAANGNAGDVANMSLGGGVYDPIDQAIYNASESSGVKFILAAGNESDDANNHSPARVNGPNIYTISASDVNDVFAYFSNYGNPPIDYCAPGVNIYSTYKSGGYATMSGTSMAAPHAAGVILLGNFTTDGVVSNDPDGNPDPMIVH